MELTVTQKIRQFLARSEQAVAPWSSVEEVMDRLYGLLYERREHEGVWRDLSGLLNSLHAHAGGVLPAPEAEILSTSRVEELVGEIRRAVRAGAELPAAGAMGRFVLGKSAGVVACIALLAAAYASGCGDSSSSQDDASTGKADTSITKADTAPSVPDSSSVKDAPVDSPAVPADAAVVEAPAQKDAPVVDASASEAGNAAEASPPVDALIDLFRDGSPADIAAKLEAAVDKAAPDVAPDRPIPIYKGVSFPTDSAV